MYEGFEIQEAIPEASSMIETFRAIGYNLETAVADIIDNSITACAKQIIIQRYWDGGNSIISIKGLVLTSSLKVNRTTVCVVVSSSSFWINSCKSWKRSGS